MLASNLTAGREKTETEENRKKGGSGPNGMFSFKKGKSPFVQGEELPRGRADFVGRKVEADEGRQSELQLWRIIVAKLGTREVCSLDNRKSGNEIEGSDRMETGENY